MENSEGVNCFVAIRDCESSKVSKSRDKQIIRLGTVGHIKYSINSKVVAVRVDNSERLSSASEEYLWELPIDSILPFDESLKPYVLAISPPRERIAFLCDEELWETLLGIDVGSMVYLMPKKLASTVKSLTNERAKRALVKYRGPILTMGLGIYFGIELLDSDATDSDTCDGSFSGSHHYFSCPPGSGKFVAINRLRPITDAIDPHQLPLPRNVNEFFPQPEKGEPNQFKTCAVQEVRAHFEKMSHKTQNFSQKEPIAKLIDISPNRSPTALDNQALKIGERVVWIDDSKQEHGVVKWLGHLDNSKELHAGIEFENPVGKCNGIYKGTQFFRTKRNHASFMPVLGLIKADDLYDHTSVDLKKKKKPLWSPTGPSPSAPEALRPDQLYSSVKSRPLDLKWENSASDALDASSCVNGSPSSPIDKDHCNVPTKKKEIPLKDMEFTLNNTNIQNLKCGQGKLNGKCGDSVCASSVDLLDICGGKIKNVARTPKVVNTSESEAVSGWAVGRSQQWTVRNKHDNDTNHSSESAGRTGSDCSGYRFSEAEDLDPDALQCPSPEDCSFGGGYYDTPEALQHFEELYDSAQVSSVQPDLGVGSVVQVLVHDEPLYGVIRWIGTLPSDKKGRKVAGIEMEEERSDFNDGTFRGQRYFECNPRRALFVNMSLCQKDGRFQEAPISLTSDTKSRTAFGQVDCPVIPGVVRPVTVGGDLQNKCGKFHGIQGHHNSCYLDATLFSMFTFTSVFDSLLYRPPTEKDSVQYEEVQRVLREEIVNPLRANLFVRADRVMKLRTLLENHSSVSGLTSEEKDPEEFLNSLIAQILRAEPYLKLSSGQEAYHYQLFVEKDEQLKLPTVQKLFEQSFLASDIKLKEVPSCLIIQMPRFGKSFKMYPRILPSQLLDVTDVIEDSPRQCTVCGKLAEFECKECMDQCDVGLENTAYCEPCLRTAHSHQRRSNHVWRQLSVPLDFKSLQEACSTIPRLYMELFAVVCIETSHYVAFVKCGSGSDAPWCFFDSMADRKGEQNGYNIPEMVPCPNLPFWLSDKGAQSLMDVHDNRQLPEHAKRLLCDAYMCMYQSSDVMMYR